MDPDITLSSWNIEWYILMYHTYVQNDDEMKRLFYALVLTNKPIILHIYGIYVYE